MSTLVFVGNLSWTTNETELIDLMSSVGEIKSAEIKRHEDSSRSKGWGLVEYSDKTSALAAVGILNLAEINGRKIHVRLERSHLSSNDGKSIFLNNIPDSMKERDLIVLLNRLDPVDCQVITTMIGHSRCFAIIKFNTKEQAELAVSELHNSTIDGRIVECKIDHREHKAGGRPVAKTILVRNVNVTVTDEMLRNHFGICGTILSIKRYNKSSTSISKENICTIKFNSCEAARRACAELHHSIIPDTSDKIRIKLKGRRLRHDDGTGTANGSDDSERSNHS